jgi:small subunit ribosomal protein S6
MTSEKVTATEGAKVRNYEMVLILRPELADEKLDAAIDSVSKFVTGHNGTVSEMVRWGKRKLAYPIKHATEGNYVMGHFNMNPSFGKELEANLGISESVLRHLLIKLD